MRWRSDFDKGVVIANFDRRGWVPWQEDEDPEDDWNIYWASVQSVRWLFSSESTVRLSDSHLVNHYPNHYELTRKDLMYKNLRQYRKSMRLREGAGGVPDEVLDFAPLTFLLPQDYSLFLEEFKRQAARSAQDPPSPSPPTPPTPNAWILKPQGKSQGKGIQIITRIAQLKKLQGNNKGPPDQYVISKYIGTPLLIGGKKFDLRIYVLVLSYAPLKAYVSRLGFARFCNVAYSAGEDDMDDLQVHLTNVAIQKHGPQYNASHGNKWGLQALYLHIEHTRGREALKKLRDSIDSLIYHSLKACQGVVVSDKHCFEMYGYDLLLDSSLKPWLLEVNASPSLTTTTAGDRQMKLRVIDDVIDAALMHRGWTDQGPPDPPPPPYAGPARPGSSGGGPRGAMGGGAAVSDRGASVSGSASQYGQGEGGGGGAARSPASIGCLDLLVDETVEYERQRREARAHLTRQRSGAVGPGGMGGMGRPTVFTGNA